MAWLLAWLDRVHGHPQQARHRLDMAGLDMAGLLTMLDGAVSHNMVNCLFVYTSLCSLQIAARRFVLAVAIWIELSPP